MSGPESQPASSECRESTRRRRLAAAALAAGLILAAAPFHLTDLDLTVAATFYDPQNPSDPWPWADDAPWTWLYSADAFLTAGMALVPLGLVVLRRRSRRARRVAAFLFLSALLGPGLVVNSILKEHWNRPRPRQLQVFGGEREYVPPWQIGPPGGGASFPSGHVAIAAVYLSYGFVWRHRRRLALAAVATAALLTGAMALARMAAGAHFLSDALWAVVLTLLVAWALSRRLLEPAPPPEP